MTGLEEPEVEEWGPLRTVIARLFAALAMLVSGAYITWRITSTIAWSAWWIAVPLVLLEAHFVVRMCITIAEVWDLHRRTVAPPTDVAPGKVAVFITTYDESVETLLPTVAAAVALAPEHETWVLDDGRRPEVAEMTAALGARYLTRTDNTHAKAGNLNHALGLVDADFVAVLDADHVPEADFLRHTLGYFADESVALVQTPQEFYNGNSFIHRGRRGRHDEQFFHRVVMAGKNRCNAAFWCGTNAVLRVSALRWVGGVSTATITEDMHTTVRMHRTGWRTVHHNEVLARGLAPRSYAEFTTQRRRWGAGSMQSLAIENPLFNAGLSRGQRFMYFASAMSWFDSWRTLLLHLVPPVVLFTGAAPVAAETTQLLIGLVVMHALWLVTMQLFGRGRLGFTSILVFELLKMPSNLASSLTLFRPRSLGFKVTPKGRTGSERRRHVVPRVLWTLLALDIAAWIWSTTSLAGLTPYEPNRPTLTVAAVTWLLFNGVMLVLAIDRIRRSDFSVERREGLRFGVESAATLDGHVVEMADVSLSGASLTTERRSWQVGSIVSVAIPVQGRVVVLDAVVTFVVGERLSVAFSPGQWSALSALGAGLFRGGLGTGSLTSSSAESDGQSCFEPA